MCKVPGKRLFKCSEGERKVQCRSVQLNSAQFSLWSSETVLLSRAIQLEAEGSHVEFVGLERSLGHNGCVVPISERSEIVKRLDDGSHFTPSS